MSLADSVAIEKNMINEVNEKLKPFRNKSGDLDLMTMCELEHMLGVELFIIPPAPTKKQLRKMKLDQLNKICERENIVWTIFDLNDKNNQWYNFA